MLDLAIDAELPGCAINSGISDQVLRDDIELVIRRDFGREVRRRLNDTIIGDRRRHNLLLIMLQQLGHRYFRGAGPTRINRQIPTPATAMPPIIRPRVSRARRESGSSISSPRSACRFDAPMSSAGRDAASQSAI